MKDFTLRIIAGANIATIVVMLLIGYSDRVNPTNHPLIANLGLLFPFSSLPTWRFSPSG